MQGETKLTLELCFALTRNKGRGPGGSAMTTTTTTSTRGWMLSFLEADSSVIGLDNDGDTVYSEGVFDIRA